MSSTNIPLWEAYIAKTISRLAVPYGTIYRGVIDTLSPKGYLLNITFILSDLILFIGNMVSVRKYIKKYNLIFTILTIFTSVGLILLALNPTGGPTTDLTHQISAAIVFISGTFLLIVTGLSIENQPTYKKNLYNFRSNSIHLRNIIHINIT